MTAGTPSRRSAITFDGTWFDGRTSTARPVTARWSAGSLLLYQDDPIPVRAYDADTYRIRPPLGSTPRVILFSDGGRLETEDHDAVAELEREDGAAGKLANLIIGLEKRWLPALTCLGLAVSIAALALMLGVPALADRAARMVPERLVQKAGTDTFAILERQYLQPSAAPADRADTARQEFLRVSGQVGCGTAAACRLEIRSSPALGANAFALPNGVVVITDELLAMTADTAALAAVFAHEISHVRHRHGFRSIFRNTGLKIVVSALAGDLSAFAATAAALPTALMHSGYLRDFEREADRDAAAYLVQSGRATTSYSRLLEKMNLSHTRSGAHTPPILLASHPDLAERLASIEAAGRSQAR